MVLSWMLLSVLLCVAVTYMSRYWKRLRRERSLTAALPGWSIWPLIGNADKFIGNSEIMFYRLLQATEKAETSKGRFRGWLGPQLVILTQNPGDIKTITNTFIEKPYYYSFGRIWIGDGLVTAPGHIWKKSIKNIAGAFSGSMVDEFQEVFNAQALKLMNQLKGEAGKPPFDALHKYLTYITLETICQTSLGATNIRESIITSEYHEAFNKTLQLVVSRGFNILYHPDIIYKLTSQYRQLKKHVQVLHDVSNRVIAKRRRERIDNKNTVTPKKVNEFNKGKQMKPFIDVLMDLNESDSMLTDEQMRSEVDTIILGGQETNSTAMSFALLILGSHRRVQDKLYSEIKSIFGDSDRAVEKGDLAKMKYCEAFIHEVLRLYPPVPGVMRYADKDLDLGDYTIPDGAVIIVSIWGTGRSKKLWGEDAEEFVPERWLDKEMPTSAAFTVFSYGRRACIGKKYSIAALKTMLAWCVRELEFKSDIGSLKLKFDMALRAISGNLLEVRLRNKTT